MLVGGSKRELLGGLGRGQAVEPVLEDRVDVTVGADADRQRPGTGGLEAGGAIAAAEAEEPQAGAVALLGVRAVGEDGGDERRGLGADGLRPLDEARRRPLEMVLVGLGHVGGGGGGPARGVIAPMGGDPRSTQILARRVGRGFVAGQGVEQRAR